jgi:serine/threonine protein kinase
LVDQITNGKVEIPKDILKTLSPECIDVFYKVLVVDYKKRITTNDLMNHPWLKDSKYDIID